MLFLFLPSPLCIHCWKLLGVRFWGSGTFCTTSRPRLSLASCLPYHIFQRFCFWRHAIFEAHQFSVVLFQSLSKLCSDHSCCHTIWWPPCLHQDQPHHSHGFKIHKPVLLILSDIPNFIWISPKHCILQVTQLFFSILYCAKFLFSRPFSALQLHNQLPLLVFWQTTVKWPPAGIIIFQNMNLSFCICKTYL